MESQHVGRGVKEEAASTAQTLENATHRFVSQMTNILVYVSQSADKEFELFIHYSDRSKDAFQHSFQDIKLLESFESSLKAQ